MTNLVVGATGLLGTEICRVDVIIRVRPDNR